MIFSESSQLTHVAVFELMQVRQFTEHTEQASGGVPPFVS